jgi:hypothetical protein
MGDAVIWAGIPQRIVFVLPDGTLPQKEEADEWERKVLHRQWVHIRAAR